VLYAAEFYRWYAEECCHVLGEVATAPASGARIVVESQPIGIALLITPWNYPAAMATRKIAPALAAGCTIVLKPATETPLTAFAVAQIMHDCGVPAGVVNVVTTSKASPLSKAVLHDPRVRKISFTGSTPVGRALLHEAADQNGRQQGIAGTDDCDCRQNPTNLCKEQMHAHVSGSPTRRYLLNPDFRGEKSQSVTFCDN